MHKFVMLALGLGILLAGCKTLNVGTDSSPLRPPRILSVVFTPLHGLPFIYGGEEFSVTVTWDYGVAPYEITINMGAHAMPMTWSESGVVSPYSHTFTGVIPYTADRMWDTYALTVRDSIGNVGAQTGVYILTIGDHWSPPTITGTYDAATKTITAMVSDPDGDQVWVCSTASGTIAVSPAIIAAAPYVFSVTAVDIIAGGSGTVTLTADDGSGWNPLPSWTSATITIAAPVLAPDTIFAIPAEATAGADEEVTITIATGFPAHPFKYLNGVGVTFQGAVVKVAGVDRFDPTAGGYYMPNSLNVGAPGGSAWPGPPEAPDGIWADLGTTFIIPAPDDLVNRTTDIGGGRVRLDLNLSPLDGTESTTVSGVLCNFGLMFGAAGTYTLGFQEFSVVKRTYYSDSASTEYFWSHYQADETGALAPGETISNEITVS